MRRGEGHFLTTHAGAPTQACVGPVAYTGQDAIARDLANLKAAKPETSQWADDKHALLVLIVRLVQNDPR